MGQLIDLCGKAVHLEEIKSFAKNVRKYVFCPCFQEVISTSETKSFFGKKTTNTTTSFQYVGAYPYGAVLNDRENPVPNDRYAIKTDAGFIINKVLDGITAPLGNAVRMVQNGLGIDRSVNMDMRIWTRGQTLNITKWGDLPAKIRYANGREVDVYPNSTEYNQLCQSITPTTKDVPTLEVQMKNNTTLIFFGAGIDIADVDSTYQALLSVHNAVKLPEQNKKNIFAAPHSSAEARLQQEAKLSEPKKPTIQIQMPQWKIFSGSNDKKQ